MRIPRAPGSSSFPLKRSGRCRYSPPAYNPLLSENPRAVAARSFPFPLSWLCVAIWD
nr:MAG TPA: hypothetical protein [Inoviridae sp.]